MSTEITTLNNGMRVVSHHMPHLETMSLGVFVAAGARHETIEEHGLSHFLEHMAFKGTSRRSARQIAELIEEVGGELNAATSLETTAYYARVLKGDESVALDVLADILQNASYGEAELAREREVILQEIAALRDSPDELAYELLQEAAFPDQALGRPVIGTPASVAGFSSAGLRAFLRRRYVASRMVLSGAGAIDHGALVRHAQALFGGLNGGSAPEADSARYVGGVRASQKPFEQSHLLIGFKSPSYREAEFFTAQVFSGLLGGGMSSRLFQEVREDRGLCYAIYSSAWGLADCGMFTIHAATGLELLAELIEVVVREIEKAAEHEPLAGEVTRAKAQLKAGLLMSLESSSARSEQMARQLLAHGRLLSAQELIERVDAVSPAAIRALAHDLVRSSPSIAVVGAGARSPDYAATARDLLVS